MRRPQTGLIKPVCDSATLGWTGRKVLAVYLHTPPLRCSHDFSVDVPQKLLFVRYNIFSFVPIRGSLTSISFENLLFSPSFSSSQVCQVLRTCITRSAYQLGTEHTVLHPCFVCMECRKERTYKLCWLGWPYEAALRMRRHCTSRYCDLTHFP